MKTRAETRYKSKDKIGNRYTVYKVLKGGMGDVYLCHDTYDNVPIALKTFQTHYLIDPDVHDNFKNENTIWIGLGKHPNIVRCFSFELIDKQPFMRVEWVSNKGYSDVSLRNRLLHGALDFKSALDFTIDICNGLIYANQKLSGIIHRDLKPENILIGQGNIAKITDFGLAQIVETAIFQSLNFNSESDQRSTIRSGNIVGTPTYMAPEQWLNGELDIRTDIYALGCILYEMLTGHCPYSSTTLEGLSRQHIESPFPGLKRDKSLPVNMNKIIAQALAKQKCDRFASFDEFLQEITKIYVEQFDTIPRANTVSNEFTISDYIERSINYMQLQCNDETLADIEHAIGMNLSSSEVEACLFALRGFIYTNLNRNKEALDDFNIAIKLDPESAMSYNGRGALYALGFQRYDEALCDINHAISLNNVFALAYNYRAMIYILLYQPFEAQNDIERVIELDDKTEALYITKALVYNFRKFKLISAKSSLSLAEGRSS